MYAPTSHQPNATPRNASFMRPALWHYAPAPYTPRRYGQTRSLRQACIAAGYSVALTQAVLATAWRRASAGKPIVWPS
jgi:hypothetical protein